MIRTGYSFHVAAGKLDEVVSRAKETGLPAVPVTDRNSTFSFVELTKASQKAGLRPVYGIEIGVVPAIGEKKPRPDYWKFLARDALRPLHDVYREATLSVGREPSLRYKDALAAPGLFKISGERVQLDQVRPDLIDETFYIGLSPALPKATYDRALALGLPFVAISDNFYPRKDDREFYRITLGSKRSNTQTYPMWIMTDEEWRASVSWFAKDRVLDSALANRDRILSSCNAALKKATLLVADKPQTLMEMCVTGSTRLNVNLADPVYGDRLKREIALIEEKNFSDYFYVIADAVAHAKTKMIVGPARGSSCGSLVCYLLGITTIDPIPYGLLFERFIDVNRADLPDIDIDFSDVRRHLVFEYLGEKYGHDRVGRLGNVNSLGVRSALNQLGISLRIPSWEIEKVAEGAIKRMQGDNRASSTIEDTLAATDAGRKMVSEYPESMIVTRMEDHPSASSQHAAGVVLTEEPIAEYVAINGSTGVIHCDKKDAEELNLLKIDALGLRQLSVFERTLELIGQPSISGWMEKNIPLDDPAVFRILNEKKFCGVFQFMGSAVRGLTEQTTMDCLEDIIAMGALARPGPLASGGANAWLRRKNGEEEVSYPHPSIKPLTENSFGTLLYQEQVMQIGRIIGGLSWEDVSALRRAMSKSLGKEFFDKYGDKWKAGAIAGGWEPEVAEKFWNELVQWGAMGFNRAHSVAYGLISYWCCWFKAHYPLEFAAATLDTETDASKQIEMLRELDREGIQYVPVDPENSTDKWEPVTRGNERILVGPLTNVEGLGPKTVAAILDFRKKGGKPIGAAVEKKLAAARTKIDSLYPIRDAVHRLHPDLAASGFNIQPTPILEVQTGLKGEFVVFALVQRINPADDNAQIKVTKRGGRLVKGPSMALNLVVADDSDSVFAKIDRHKFEKWGKMMIEQGGPGKSLWAIKGTCPDKFRMISVIAVKYIGRIDDYGVNAEEEEYV